MLFNLGLKRGGLCFWLLVPIISCANKGLIPLQKRDKRKTDNIYTNKDYHVSIRGLASLSKKKLQLVIFVSGSKGGMRADQDST